jgi:uroporphyrinogen-III decarboxylase
MNHEHWSLFKRAVTGETLDFVPVALIVDSPWIPGFLGLSTLDYLTIPSVWLEANLALHRRFPDVMFLPGFWIEMGMAAEPSGFGCRVSFYSDKTPAVHPLTCTLEALLEQAPPDPRADGLMPLILNAYRHAQARAREAGHPIRIVAARGPLTVATHLRGVTEFLLDLKLRPAETHRLLQITTTLVRTWLEAQAEVLPDVEGVLVLDDIAGFVSPKDYNEFAHPYLRTIFDAFPGTLKLFHNDTHNATSYHRLPELGIHLFNFTHLEPLDRVRTLVGPGLCLLGNVPPLEVLAQGDASAVRNAARECLRTHPDRRGLILSAGGGTSPGTPAENIDALAEAARTP